MHVALLFWQDTLSDLNYLVFLDSLEFRAF